MDFHVDEATDLTKTDACVLTCRGQKKLLNTTSGWKLLIRWKYVSEQLIHLKDIKE